MKHFAYVLYVGFHARRNLCDKQNVSSYGTPVFAYERGWEALLKQSFSWKVNFLKLAIENRISWGQFLKLGRPVRKSRDFINFFNYPYLFCSVFRTLGPRFFQLLIYAALFAVQSCWSSMAWFLCGIIFLQIPCDVWRTWNILTQSKILIFKISVYLLESKVRNNTIEWYNCIGFLFRKWYNCHPL